MLGISEPAHPWILGAASFSTPHLREPVNVPRDSSWALAERHLLADQPINQRLDGMPNISHQLMMNRRQATSCCQTEPSPSSGFGGTAVGLKESLHSSKMISTPVGSFSYSSTSRWPRIAFPRKIERSTWRHSPARRLSIAHIDEQSEDVALGPGRFDRSTETERRDPGYPPSGG
jgi:hypothetical protein